MTHDEIESEYQKQISAADAKRSADIAHAEASKRIALLFGMIPAFVHMYTLYGTRGTIIFKMWERYSSLGTRLVTLADVYRIASLFPVVGLTRARYSGFVSFWPVPHVETVSSLPDGDRRRRDYDAAQLEYIAPFIAEVDPGDAIRIKWNAQLPEDLGVWEIVIDCAPFVPDLTSWNIVRTDDRNRDEADRRIVRKELHPNAKVRMLHRDGEEVARLGRETSYGGGTPEDPGRWIMVWESESLGLTPAEPADLFRAMWGTPNETPNNG